jgi:FtsP/CotA-like multicopper oxidase with cupredoxin domain
MRLSVPLLAKKVAQFRRSDVPGVPLPLAMILVRLVFAVAVFVCGCLAAPQEQQPPTNSPQLNGCARSQEGSVVPEPEDLRSKEGVLRVELAFRSALDPSGQTNFCYVDNQGRQAPNLRLHPGDTLILALRNEASSGAIAGMSHSGSEHGAHAENSSNVSSTDGCSGNAMTPLATNVHFHGLEIPPVCHQDETLKTSIKPFGRPFEYRFQVPPDTPPGLYWYHPHPHGFSKLQVLGGASGALIIEGVEQEAPVIAGLPERVLIVRDQDLLHPDAQPVKTDSMPAPQVLRDAEGDILNTGTGTGKPAKDLSINFVPVPFPRYVPAVIKMKPAEKEYWRVLNASAITYLDLQVLIGGKPQMVGVVALDGVPLHEAGNNPRDVVWRSHLSVPPAGRVEFIVQGPPLGTQASLVTRTVDTGPAGENDPTRPLATMIAAAGATTHSSLSPLPGLAAPKSPAGTQMASVGAAVVGKNPNWVGNFPAVHARKLYFSEESEDPANPNSPTKFYITVDGQTPKQFDMNDPAPNIVVQQGDIEEWTIENRTRELHAFHIHQIHFQLMEWNGVPLDEPFLRDTINVPYWDGSSQQFPSIKLKMDFRDPRIIGTFVYHCHLLEHEDGGMMGTIRVDAVSKR